MVLLLWQQHEKSRVRPGGSALIHEMKLEQCQTNAFFICNYQFHFDIYFCTAQTSKFVCSHTVHSFRSQTSKLFTLLNFCCDVALNQGDIREISEDPKLPPLMRTCNNLCTCITTLHPGQTRQTRSGRKICLLFTSQVCDYIIPLPLHLPQGRRKSLLPVHAIQSCYCSSW